jgi:site-specific DNA-cytosine methylase
MLGAEEGCQAPDVPPKTKDPVTVSDALSELEGVPAEEGTGYVQLPNGEWTFHHNSEGTTKKFPRDYVDLSKCKHEFCPTVLRETALKHYSPNLPGKRGRNLTLRERAQLFGFPYSYFFRGSNSDVADQIGNAVPVSLAHSLGESLMKCHITELVPDP